MAALIPAPNPMTENAKARKKIARRMMGGICMVGVGGDRKTINLRRARMCCLERYIHFLSADE